MIQSTGMKIGLARRPMPKRIIRSARSMSPPLAASPRLSAFER